MERRTYRSLTGELAHLEHGPGRKGRAEAFDMLLSGYPFHSPNSGRLADILGVMMEW